ncbi:MAG: glycosidase, partial [Planctomycetota bacterium]
MLTRFDNNPILTPADVKPSSPEMEVLCAFNVGATVYNGETLLLVRVAERPVPEDGVVKTAFLDPEQPG